jgi:hypothetical protein
MKVSAKGKENIKIGVNSSGCTCIKNMVFLIGSDLSGDCKKVIF